MPENYSLIVSSPPATTSITLAEAKAHLNQDESADDALITTLIEAADSYVQNDLSRSLVTQTRVLKLNCFPDYICLPYPPLASVTSITYLDSTGTSQTLGASVYAVDTSREPGRITLKYAQVWPATQAIENAVTITYVAGYGAAAAVPSQIKAAVKLLVGHWFEQREAIVIGETVAEVPLTVQNLLTQIRNWEVS